MRRTHSEVVDVERVFVDVGCVCPDGYASAGCQIATVASHGLHHKHPSLGPSGRLLDFITALLGWEKKYNKNVSMKRKTLANKKVKCLVDQYGLKMTTMQKYTK